MTDHPPSDAHPDDEHDEDKAVRSIPLDTEDGGTVVIEQQNMGGDQQVGGGEYKNVSSGRSVEQAAAEQAQLERTSPINEAPSDRSVGH